MKIKCEYCKSSYEDVDTKCPNCGALNQNVKRFIDDTPTTVEELISWCNKNSIPYYKLHFRLGEDSKESKIFGIYKDTKSGEYIVYKNKLNGSRAIRYKGYDEAYAVNELFLKIKEIALISRESYAKKNGVKADIGKSYGRSSVSDAQNYYDRYHAKRMYKSNFSNKKRSSLINLIKIYMCINIVTVLLYIVTIFINPNLDNSYSNGYYTNGDDVYYNQRDDWYYYDTTSDSWIHYYEDDYDEFDYSSKSYYDYYNVSDFRDSIYYVEYTDSYDYDYDYDDSWDSYDYDYDYDFDYSYDWDSDW